MSENDDDDDEVKLLLFPGRIYESEIEALQALLEEKRAELEQIRAEAAAQRLALMKERIL